MSPELKKTSGIELTFIPFIYNIVREYELLLCNTRLVSVLGEFAVTSVQIERNIFCHNEVVLLVTYFKLSQLICNTMSLIIQWTPYMLILKHLSIRAYLEEGFEFPRFNSFDN